jgi:anti-sigma factor RsiW
MIVIGGAVVYQLTEMSTTVLAAELTADHIKCFTLNAVFGTHQTATVVEAAMLGGFGWNMHLPDNPAQAGLELVGSRTCLDGEGTIAHLMYKHDGHPLSVFMLPKSTRAERLVGVLGHQAKIWCAGNRTFVLVSSEPRQEVEQLAQFVQTSLH